MNLQSAKLNQRAPILLKNNSSDNKVLQIKYNLKINFIEVTGWSVSKDVSSQYEKLLSRLTQFLETESELIMRFKLEMFNTTSIKYLLSIIKLMNKAHSQGKSVKIFWKVNANRDDEMTEAALDLSLLCNFEFNIITDNSKIDTKSIEDKQVMDHRRLLFRQGRGNSSIAA